MQAKLTRTQHRDIYNHIQYLVDLAVVHHTSIYAGLPGSYLREISEIREYLERTYKFRFVNFKPEGAYITNLPKDQQWTYALFIAEFVLSGDWR